MKNNFKNLNIINFYKKKHLLSFLIFILFLSLILILTDSNLSIKSKASSDSKIYLPASLKDTNKNDEKFNHIAGIELDLYDNVNQFNRMEGANAYWVRSNAWAIDWKRLEPNGPGEYNPSDPNYGGQFMREYEYLMATAYARGFKVIQIIRGAPSWASPADKEGCAIRPEHYDNFANFVNKIVAKYSKAPYNIQYWEIWNEPDGLKDVSDPNGLFGCWGDPSDAQYFGGRAYGEMFIKASGAVLRADPPDASRSYEGSRVVFGGLLLDCLKPCPSADFLDGALSVRAVVDGRTTSAGQWFHVMNFHAYDIWRDSTVAGHYNNPNFGSAWNTSGPTVAAKTDFVRSVLNNNGSGSKAIMNTEAAVQCYCVDLSSEVWNETKAIYAAQSNATAKAKGLLANVWHSYSGWTGHQTDLMPGRGEKAYQAFKTSATQLKDARFIGEDTGYPGLKVYKFNRRGNLLLVAWKLGDGGQAMSLPATPVSIADTFGNAVTPAQAINVTLYPLYIEFSIPTDNVGSAPIVPTSVVLPSSPTPTARPTATATPNPCNTRDCREPNNSFEQAIIINVNEQVLASVNINGDPNDYYRINLQAGKRYSIRLNFSGNADLDLYIYGPDRNEIIKSKNEGAVPEEVILRVTKDDVYYMLVSVFVTNGPQQYELVVGE